MAKNFSEIGINYSAFNNVSFESINNITNQSSNQFIESIPATANSITDGWFGIVMLVVMGIWLLWMLMDQTNFGYFRYSSVRALGISLGIVITFGINMVQIGWMTSFIHLTILTTIYIMVLSYIIITNPS